MKEWFATVALRSFHISVPTLKPSIFLKTFSYFQIQMKKEGIGFAAGLASRQEEFRELV